MIDIQIESGFSCLIVPVSVIYESLFQLRIEIFDLTYLVVLKK